ncbi:hypothetical protein [Paludibacterium paludis]|uniref:Uncharacterized protein n=1 Tax=Paludibacterium paludis TaxID=1225769 RepID=A0A918P5G4_9NEIS|nr:hypothetical protein [Paludibacterium paludis]GGY25910.1 hypothetical protein GCM10011289_31820 [Paludibacterium paludis]
MQYREKPGDRGLVRLFGPAVANHNLTLSGVRKRAGKALDRFDRYVRLELESQGVALPPAVDLVSCPNCELALGSEHPQSDTILAWMSGNVKLAKRFKEVEVLYELIRAAEQPDAGLPDEICFHIGVTSAGPVAYFAVHLCETPA